VQLTAMKTSGYAEVVLYKCHTHAWEPMYTPCNMPGSGQPADTCAAASAPSGTTRPVAPHSVAAVGGKGVKEKDGVAVAAAAEEEADTYYDALKVTAGVLRTEPHNRVSRCMVHSVLVLGHLSREFTAAAAIYWAGTAHPPRQLRYITERYMVVKKWSPANPTMLLSQAEMGGRAARTRAALDALDPGQRLAMEGHRPGAYLRLRFSGTSSTNRGHWATLPCVVQLLSVTGCRLSRAACADVCFSPWRRTTLRSLTA
jgi:hypothetical protein